MGAGVKPRRAAPLKRLVDAEPAWVNEERGKPKRLVGVTFDCPIHPDCRIGVPFKNPVTGGPPPKWTGLNGTQWQRTGETFEALTLSPSIHIMGEPDDCEWHGFIRAGCFETCGDSR